MTTAETHVPDGTANPFVLDLDDVWHRRPADDEWDRAEGRPEDPQARTLCGIGVHSVEVSSHEPDCFDEGQRLCRTCDGYEPWSTLTTF